MPDKNKKRDKRAVSSMIKKIRGELDLSKKELTSKLGCSYSHLSNLENKNYDVSSYNNSKVLAKLKDMAKKNNIIIPRVLEDD